MRALKNPEYRREPQGGSERRGRGTDCCHHDRDYRDHHAHGGAEDPKDAEGETAHAEQSKRRHIGTVRHAGRYSHHDRCGVRHEVRGEARTIRLAASVGAEGV